MGGELGFGAGAGVVMGCWARGSVPNLTGNLASDDPIGPSATSSW